MRKSLFDLWPYDEATLFDLVLYDYDKATHFDELPDAALEVAASKGAELAGRMSLPSGKSAHDST